MRGRGGIALSEVYEGVFLIRILGFGIYVGTGRVEPQEEGECVFPLGKPVGS